MSNNFICSGCKGCFTSLVVSATSLEKNKDKSKGSSSSYKFRVTDSRLCRHVPESNQRNTRMTLRRHAVAAVRDSAEGMWLFYFNANIRNNFL